MSAYLVWRSMPTSSSFCCTSAPRSTAPAEVAAPGNGFVSAAWRVCAAARRVLEGTQPTFTQVPPSVPDSMATTLAPSSRAWIAADIAAPPVPTTARSNSLC